jgi:hypothetical protein
MALATDPAVRWDLCSTDTDACISIGRIQARGYIIFQKKIRYADTF